MDWFSENRKIGIGLTGFGSLFLLLGVAFFFDRALLALGNILFVSGIVAWIGISMTAKFFTNPAKWRGTFCFFLGIFLVILGYPMIGMCIEFFGIINLFGNFFPVILAVLRRIPLVRDCLNAPVVSRVMDKVAGPSFILPVTNRD